MNGETLKKQKPTSSKWLIGIIISIISIVLAGGSLVGSIVFFALTAIVGSAASLAKQNGGDYVALEAQSNLYGALLIVFFVLFLVLVIFGIVFLIVSISKRRKALKEEQSSIANFQ